MGLYSVGSNGNFRVTTQTLISLSLQLHTDIQPFSLGPPPYSTVATAPECQAQQLYSKQNPSKTTMTNRLPPCPSFNPFIKQIKKVMIQKPKK